MLEHFSNSEENLENWKYVMGTWQIHLKEFAYFVKLQARNMKGNIKMNSFRNISQIYFFDFNKFFMTILNSKNAAFPENLSVSSSNCIQYFLSFHGCSENLKKVRQNFMKIFNVRDVTLTSYIMTSCRKINIASERMVN